MVIRATSSLSLLLVASTYHDDDDGDDSYDDVHDYDNDDGDSDDHDDTYCSVLLPTLRCCINSCSSHDDL